MKLSNLKNCVEMSVKGEKEEKEYDVFRDSPVRYLGYANEIGESFRPIFPRLVIPSYAISFAYVGADTLDKAKKHYDRTNRFDIAATQAFDTIVWQTFASVFVPGFTINRVVKACGYGLKHYGRGVPLPLVRWLPTAVGIGIIPFIIHPIDDLVHNVMDNSVRKLYK